MFRKINIISIVTDHIATLKNFDTTEDYEIDNYKKKPLNRYEIFLFFVIPGILSCLLVYTKIELNSNITNTLITAFSVLTALLFNLLMLIYDIIKKGGQDKTRLILIREIYNNISYTILVSICLVIFLGIILYTFPTDSNKHGHLTTQTGLSLVIYYFLFNFVFTLLMILKRVHSLLSTECMNQYEERHREIENNKNRTPPR